MKSILIIIAFTISFQKLSYADDGHSEICCDDVENTISYKIDDQGKVEQAAKESAEQVAGSIALDLYWAKEKIKGFAPHLVTETVDKLVNQLLKDFRTWMENAAGPLVNAAASNAVLKYQVALAEKHPKLKGLGVYCWEKGNFANGSWTGGDIVLDGDTGVTAGFKAEMEFNVGAGIIAEAEAKFQIAISGSAGVLMLNIASKTITPTGATLKVSGKPYGKATAKSSFEGQTGFSGQTDIESSKNFTHEKREVITLQAIERDGNCGQ